jgi:ATP-dependent helicase/nuclease subunit A
MKSAAEEKLLEQVTLYEKKERLKHASEYADKDATEELQHRFSFVYPYESMKRLYTKTTVSELKTAAMADTDEAAFHAFEEKEIVPYIPAFMRSGDEISGTVRGNAFHRAMELLDFDRILREQFECLPENYESYVKQLDTVKLRERVSAFFIGERDSLRLSAEYYEALNIKKIVNFLRSSLALRMWSADLHGELYREQPFVLGIEAGRLIKDISSDEKVLIQGIIDAFFVEDGAIVLLDYKTDVVKSMEQLHARYDTQLAYYEEALGKITGMDIKEKLLYSFYLEKCGV